MGVGLNSFAWLLADLGGEEQKRDWEWCVKRLGLLNLAATFFLTLETSYACCFTWATVLPKNKKQFNMNSNSRPVLTGWIVNCRQFRFVTDSVLCATNLVLSKRGVTVGCEGNLAGFSPLLGSRRCWEKIFSFLVCARTWNQHVECQCCNWASWNWRDLGGNTWKGLSPAGNLCIQYIPIVITHLDKFG